MSRWGRTRSREGYIEGRELYVGVIGNDRLRTFPVWEMHFDKMPSGVHRIATDRVKWSVGYQRKHGIQTWVATQLPDGLAVDAPTDRQACLPRAEPERIRTDGHPAGG